MSNWEKFAPMSAPRFTMSESARVHSGHADDRRFGRSHISAPLRRFRVEFRPDDGTPVQVLADGPGVETCYLHWADHLTCDQVSGWLLLIDRRTEEAIIRRHLPR